VGFLKRDQDDGPDDDAGADGAPEAAAQDPTAGDAAPEEAPAPGEYAPGSLEGVPEAGRARVERMKRDAAAGFFTCDLSPNELLVVREAGFDPLGLVLGSSIYHIGFQQANWSKNE